MYAIRRYYACYFFRPREQKHRTPFFRPILFLITRAPQPHRDSTGAVRGARHYHCSPYALPRSSGRARAPPFCCFQLAHRYSTGAVRGARHYHCSPYALPRVSGRARAPPPFVGGRSRAQGPGGGVGGGGVTQNVTQIFL